MEAGPYEAIADVYDVWCAEVTEDVAFYRAQCAGAAGPVVELGAGTGRIAVPVAGDGHRVVAVDRSPGMLACLAARAEAAGVADRVEVLVGTLEQLPPLPPTDRVLAPFRTLLHLPDDDERVRVLAAVRRTLVPGGRLVFDVFEPTADDVRATHDRWIQRGSGVRERARWDEAARTIDLEVRFRGRSTRMLLHYVPGSRWSVLLEAAGLEVVAAYRDFEGRPFRGRPGDSAWVAARPAGS